MGSTEWKKEVEHAERSIKAMIVGRATQLPGVIHFGLNGSGSVERPML